MDINYFFRLLSSCSIIILIASNPCFAGEPFKATQMKDGTYLYEFEDGVKCYKRPDYTTSISADGSIAIKSIFSLGGSLNQNIQKLREASPKTQEFEAIAFDLCFEFGMGRISAAEYKKRKSELWDAQKQIISPDAQKTDDASSSRAIQSVHQESHGSGSHNVSGVKGNVIIKSNVNNDEKE